MARTERFTRRPGSGAATVSRAARLRSGSCLVRSCSGERRIAALFGRDGRDGEHGEQEGHGGKDGPPLPVVLDHPAESEAERGGDQQPRRREAAHGPRQPAVAALGGLWAIARMPLDAVPSALQYIGQNVGVRRGLTESDDSYRARLQRALDDYQRAMASTRRLPTMAPSA